MLISYHMYAYIMPWVPEVYVKVIEYWVTTGRSEGLEPGEQLEIYAGKYWKQAKNRIGDPDVFYIERVTSIYADYGGGLVDREEESVWVNEE